MIHHVSILEFLLDAAIGALIALVLVGLITAVAAAVCGSRKSPEDEAWTRPDLLDPGPRPSHLPPPNDGAR